MSRVIFSIIYRALLTRALYALAVVYTIASVPSLSAATLTEYMDIECHQAQAVTLKCDYRILDGAQVVATRAEHNGIVVGAQSQVRESERATAVLFLVDTSDPARSAVVEKNREHVLNIVEQAPPHHVFGLASFDANLESLCALPCARDEIKQQVGNLNATGKTTELYRNVLQAIRKLADYDVSTRLLVLMSDGLAEDMAYHHEDVIAAAREAQVVITTLGYPRSVAQSTALQTLRRLSEETGGLFAQANHIDSEIPARFFATVIAAIDSGGQLEFDLSALGEAQISGDVDLSLAFETTERNFLVMVPVTLPEPIVEPAVQPQSPPTTETSSAPAATTSIPQGVHPAATTHTAVRADGTWTWFWYGLPAMVFSAILAVALAYAVIGRRTRDDSLITTGEQSTPHAFLVSADDESKRYYMDRTPWRIGRSRSSELRLDDTSISRLHAEIRRDALGQFTVQDLESLNGVFVNGEPIDIAHLDEGDRIEVGDVGFVFTQFDEDYAKQEPTVLVKTRTPVPNLKPV